MGGPAPHEGGTGQLRRSRSLARQLREDVRLPIATIIAWTESCLDRHGAWLNPDDHRTLGCILASGRRLDHLLLEQIEPLERHVETVDSRALRLRIGNCLAGTLALVLEDIDHLHVAWRGRTGAEVVLEDLARIRAAGEGILLQTSASPSERRRRSDITSNEIPVDPLAALTAADTVLRQGIDLAARGDLVGARILVAVGDTPTLAWVIGHLDRVGATSIGTNDGLIAQERCLAGGIDLVLADAFLERCDGIALCRSLKGDPLTAAIPVLLLTVLGDRRDRLAGVAAGALDVLVLPVDRGELLLRLRNAMAIKRLHDQSVHTLAQVQEHERLRDTLVQLVVHDLRSPLAGLNGYVELLDRRLTGAEPAVMSVLERIQDQCRAVSELVDEVLDVGRFEAGRMPVERQDGDLVTVVRDAVSLVGRPALEAPVAIEGPDSCPMHADVGLVRRVLINLIANAVRFTPRGAGVRVRIERREHDVACMVADRGPGIEAAFQQLIFEKFGRLQVEQNRHAPGSGLGLTFCRLAIEAHGGSIRLESAPGQGAVFCFTIPD